MCYEEMAKYLSESFMLEQSGTEKGNESFWFLIFFNL